LDIKSQLNSVLKQHPHIVLAILFGSLANNTATKNSDLDLAVAAKTTLNTHKKMQLMADLAVLTGRPVDLIDLNTVGEPLLGQILQKGQKILGIDAHHAALLNKHLLNQADFMPYQKRILATRRQAWMKSFSSKS
jgi:predicted nucleotidyltransferase